MKIAVVGFGIVGSGVAVVLRDNAAAIEARCGQPVELGYIVDLRAPAEEWQPYWTKNFEDAIADPAVGAVVEAIGGVHPAYDFTKRALEAGRHVVTSNKQLVSECGAELLRIAREHGVSYLFEASVGGGIPLIGPLARNLGTETITDLWGILNGTTNFIMACMNDQGMTFADALALAQKNGYAEADPTADIEGIDACRKTSILASMLAKKTVAPDKIATEGVSRLDSGDVAAAAAVGCEIKLICRVHREGEAVCASVAPMLVPLKNPLASVDGVNNAVLVRGVHLGDAMFYGRGAGSLPTANAIVSDIVEAVESGRHMPYFSWSDEPAETLDADTEPCVWMLRCAREDIESVSEIFGASTAARVEDEAVLFTMRLSHERLRALGAEAANHGFVVRSAVRVAEF